MAAVKADAPPMDHRQPDWSCDSVPVLTTCTSPCRRKLLTSLLADAKKRIKEHTGRPPGSQSKSNENATSGKREVSIASPSIRTSDIVHSNIADNMEDDEVPGLSDDEDMPSLVKPDADSDEESIYNGVDAESDDGESSEHDEAQHEVLADTYARLVSIVKEMSHAKPHNAKKRQQAIIEVTVF